MAIAQLLIRVAADVDPLKSGMDKATAQLDRLQVAANTVGERLSSLLPARGGIAAGAKNAATEIGGIVSSLGRLNVAIGGLAIGAVVNDFIQFTGSLTDISAQTGITVRELQRFKYAGDLVGVSLDQVTSAIGQMQNRLGSLDTSAVAGLRQLGLSLEQITALNPGEQFELIASRIAQINDPAKRAAVAMDLFGRSGVSLMPLLRNNLKEVGDEAERLGVILSDKTVKGGDDLGDALTRLTAIGRTVVAGALQPLIDAIDQIQTRQQNLKAELDFVESAFNIVGLSVKGLVTDLQDLARWYDVIRGKASQPLPAPAAPQLSAGTRAPTMTVEEADRLALKLKQELDAINKRADEARRIADAWRDSVEQLRDQLSGAALQTEVRRLADAVAALNDEQRQSPASMDRVREAAFKLRREGAFLGPELAKLADESESFKRANEDISKALARTMEPLRQYVEENRRLTELYPAVIEHTMTATDWINRQAAALERAAKAAAESLGKKFAKDQEDRRKAIASATEEMERQIRVARTLNDTISGFGDTFGRLIGGFAGEAISQMSRAFGNLTEAILSAKAANQSFLSTAQGGAAVYNLAMTGVLLWVDAMDRANARIAAFRREVRQFGGEAALMNAAVTAGFQGLGVSALRSESLTLLQRLREGITDADERLQRYNLTWRDLGQTIRQSNISEMARQIVEDFKRLTSPLVGADPAKVIKGMSDALSQLVVDAVKTGTKIPGALEPLIKQLIETRQLSEDAARALLGMSEDSVPAFRDIEEAARRYGIQLDALGPKVQQIRINEAAAQITKDFELMEQAGADMNQVMLGMQKQIQAIVIDALKMGLSLPESMRKIIEKMIEAGLLTDEFGEKLGDTSRLNFAKPITEKIDELIDALKALVDHFNKVGEAAGRARGEAEKMGQAIPRGSIPGEGGGTGGTGGSGGRTQDTLNLDRGRVLQFPTATVDTVSNEKIVVQTFLDGRLVAENTARHLPGVLRRQGI